MPFILYLMYRDVDDDVWWCERAALKRGAKEEDDSKRRCGLARHQAYKTRSLANKSIGFQPQCALFVVRQYSLVHVLFVYIIYVYISIHSVSIRTIFQPSIHDAITIYALFVVVYLYILHVCVCVYACVEW